MRIRIALTVLLASAVFGQQTDAQQSLTESLFARYLEALREEAAIPGMSGLVLQQGNIVWERNFGRQDLESGLAPRADTPYLIGGMSQIVGSTLLLRACVDEQARDLHEHVADWIPGFSDSDSTLLHLLAHAQPNGEYRYDSGRFSMLTPITERCADVPYQRLLGDGFSFLSMTASVPGTALATPNSDDIAMFGTATLERYRSVLSRLATPYSVDTTGRATRREVVRQRVNAWTGVVTSAYDLALFDRAFDTSLLLEARTRQAALSKPAGHLPTGLGWFVQTYNGQQVAWQFGIVPGAYSSLIVKVPAKQLTFILLANSDGLSAPFALENGDVTASLFARTFLLLYVP